MNLDPSPFEARTELLDGGTTVVSISGELDMETAPRFDTELRAAAASGLPNLIVDLTDCEFLDSSALNVLVKAKQHLDGTGPHLSLVISSAQILKVFEITQLDKIFEIHHANGLAAGQRNEPANRE